MDLQFLRKYVPLSELSLLCAQMDGEEGEFFRELLEETEAKIRAVPPLYANEELGKKAPVALHYFGGASDYWITELDQETGDAFGFACVNGDWDSAELGYVSIPEIVATNLFKLDLYWDDTTTLVDVMK